MIHINTRFRFNRAGQGCFYSGKISDGSRCFNFIYDCGTDGNSESLNREVEDHIVNMCIRKEDTIDLLVVSHFDYDHISHINFLLSGVKTCKRIILPYLSEVERIYLFYACNSEDEEYKKFLIDPVTFLTQNNNVNEIIFIDGSSDEIAAPLPDPNNPLSDLNNDKIFEIDLSEVKDIEPPIELQPLIGDNGSWRVRFVKNNFRVFVSKIWEFYFYNSPQDPKVLEDFKKEIACKYPGLFSKEKDVSKIKSIFETKSRKSAVNAIYKKNFNIDEVNSTSLIVCHGPINFRYSNWFFLKDKKRRNNRYHYKLRGDGQIGLYTLLTGDIYTQRLTLPPYIKNIYDRITFIQIPHHGSKNKWDFSVLNLQPSKDKYAFINFGLGNKHKHPSSNVIDDISSVDNWKIKLNTQLKSINYHMNLIYKI